MNMVRILKLKGRRIGRKRQGEEVGARRAPGREPSSAGSFYVYMNYRQWDVASDM